MASKGQQRASKIVPMTASLVSAAVPPIPHDQWIRLRCLEIVVINGSRAGVENPFGLAKMYADFVLTGTQDVA